MRVLLTGANGFVGSHILDCLCAQGVATVVLLRPAGNQQFIREKLPSVTVRFGMLDDPEALRGALEEVTHVIHCAGATKALQRNEFYQVNEHAPRRLVEAINQFPGQIRRLVHFSSLAAAGPATAQAPAREDDPPRPVSEYGKSKLAGEQAVRAGCRAEFTILRPPAVYGPRDAEFLKLFKAVKAHLCPRFGGDRQAFSLVFVRDLAAVALGCLTHPVAAGRTYNVATSEVVTAGGLARQIAAELNTWTLPLPLPTAMLWPICLAQEGLAQLTGRARVLSRQKYAELRAPGWVCDVTRLREELGPVCPTGLGAGLAQTAAWYKEQRWL